jgi:PEP-CTERM motif
MTYSFKITNRLPALGAILLSLAASPAHATAYLFTSAGAGLFGITAVSSGTNVINLALNGTISMPANNQVAIALGTGDHLTMTGGTASGQVDFADPAGTSTGGSCPADAGGICKVNTGSSVAAGSTITGLTQQNASAVTAAVNEWNGLIGASGWTGAAATNVSLASAGTICTGSFTGCSLVSVAAPTTRMVNGVLQTAYVFNITSSTIGGAITIKGDGTALIILQYSVAGTKLSTAAGSKITLTGGVNSDQVLLDDTSNSGIDTSAGFNYTGALAISPGSATATTNLNSLVINGRLFVSNNTAGTTTVNLGSGFNLAPTPEPSTFLLIGGALIGIAVLSKRVRRS